MRDFSRYLDGHLHNPQIASGASRWEVTITSSIGTITGMAYEELLALPETNVTANLACYGTPIAYGDWQGVKLSDILNQGG
jgi:DMSO/TMAO reductase YedYZ molybdopterin-dependent catalytic subunit